MFIQATRNTGKSIANKNIANPTATLLAGCVMLDHLKCVCMNINFIIFIGCFTNIPVIRSLFPSCIMTYTIIIHTNQENVAAGLELCILFMSGLSFPFPRLHAYARMIRKAVLKTLSETQV